MGFFQVQVVNSERLQLGLIRGFRFSGDPGLEDPDEQPALPAHELSEGPHEIWDTRYSNGRSPKPM